MTRIHPAGVSGRALIPAMLLLALAAPAAAKETIVVPPGDAQALGRLVNDAKNDNKRLLLSGTYRLAASADGPNGGALFLQTGMDLVGHPTAEIDGSALAVNDFIVKLAGGASTITNLILRYEGLGGPAILGSDAKDELALRVSHCRITGNLLIANANRCLGFYAANASGDEWSVAIADTVITNCSEGANLFNTSDGAELDIKLTRVTLSNNDFIGLLIAGGVSANGCRTEARTEDCDYQGSAFTVIINGGRNLFGPAGAHGCEVEVVSRRDTFGAAFAASLEVTGGTLTQGPFVPPGACAVASSGNRARVVLEEPRIGSAGPFVLQLWGAFGFAFTDPAPCSVSPGEGNQALVVLEDPVGTPSSIVPDVHDCLIWIFDAPTGPTDCPNPNGNQAVLREE